MSSWSGRMLPLKKPPGYRDPNKSSSHRLPPPQLKAKCGRNWCLGCCLWCGVVVALLILLLFSLGVFFFMWFHPQVPEILLKSVEVTKIDIASTSNEGGVLNLESTISIKIINPNEKLGIRYETTRVSLKYENSDVNLGESEVPGFDQDAENITNIELKTKANERITNEEAQDLKEGYENNNLLADMELESRIGVKGSGWGTNPVAINVACEGIQLMSRGRDGSDNPKCRVTLMNRFEVN